MAPGQDVTSYGFLGMLESFSGSSMAAPQVSALAALLWQQDLTKSNEFIRQLIDVTARSLGSKDKFGYGLIDYEYALQNYAAFEKQYRQVNSNSAALEIKNNTEQLLCVDEETVKGYWGKEIHKSIAKKMGMVKEGTIWPDKKNSKIAGMTQNPAFHGYYKEDYVASYIFITKVASKMYNKGKWLSEEKCTESQKKILKKIKEATVNNGFKKNCKTKQDKGLFIYGMALHTVADIFAHSTMGIREQDPKRATLKKKTVKKLCKKWKYLNHGARNSKTNKFDPKKNYADNVNCLSDRYHKSAVKVCKAVVETSINKHKIGSKKVFSNIKYYKKCADAKKYKKAKDKKNYLLYSYGVLNLSVYLEPGKNKKLKKVVNNASNSKIKAVIKKWQ